jgi:hypothetical protein
MLFLTVLFVFSIAAMVTGGLAHDERRWQYAFAVTVTSSILLATWSGKLLAMAMKALSLPVHPVTPFGLAAAPFALVLAHLCLRRYETPRHIPGPDDDPVLRRYREEKLRRRRRARQLEEMESSGDDLSCR